MSEQLHATPRCLLVEVIKPHAHRDAAIRNLNELELLVKTYGATVVERIVQHRVMPDTATYIGHGKVGQLKTLVREMQIDVVVLNAIVNTGQIFRLEKALWEINPRIAVWDKADLILHIFDQHAVTAEAKLQIELARLQHIGPRIYGLGGTLLSRQAGGIGTRGLGETNIELMRRYIKTRMRKVKQKLQQISQMKRNTIERRKIQGIPTIALVGYTNAGKTTLFNQLTQKEKQIRNSLFTTLDSVVGRLGYRLTNSQILVSDTIGFIEGLPPFLIDAFRSTLMESVHANLLLNIVDAADTQMERKIEVVEAILQELGVKAKAILVFNKIDEASPAKLAYISNRYQDQTHLLLSAKTRQGFTSLAQLITSSFCAANRT